MKRISSLLLATVAIVAFTGYTYPIPEVPVPGSGGSTTPVAATTTLNGTVGPGFKITLTKAGKTFTSLKAGKYKIIVDDKATVHNFHLTGPSLNKTTTVPQIAKVTWNVTLKKGTFTYKCDPHTNMKKTFKVI